MSKRRTHYGKSPIFVQKYNFDEYLKKSFEILNFQNVDNFGPKIQIYF